MFPQRICCRDLVFPPPVIPPIPSLNSEDLIKKTEGDFVPQVVPCEQLFGPPIMQPRVCSPIIAGITIKNCCEQVFPPPFISSIMQPPLKSEDLVKQTEGGFVAQVVPVPDAPPRVTFLDEDEEVSLGFGWRDETNFEEFGLGPLCVLAIDFFNDKHDTKYEFLKIHWAFREMVGSGYNFYITFEACQNATTQIFQTLVWKSFVTGEEDKIFGFCRLKATRCLFDGVEG